MEDDELSAYLIRLLNNSVPKFRKCKNNLNDRDDILEQFNMTLFDEDIEILANLMVIEWLRPQVNNLELLKQALSSKDFNISSQANHLKELQALRKRCSI